MTETSLTVNVKSGTTKQVVSLGRCIPESMTLTNAGSAQTISLVDPWTSEVFDTFTVPDGTAFPEPYTIPFPGTLAHSYPHGLALLQATGNLSGTLQLRETFRKQAQDITFTLTYAQIAAALGLANHPANGIDKPGTGTGNYSNADTDTIRLYIPSSAKATGNKLLVMFHPVSGNQDTMFGYTKMQKGAEDWGFCVLSLLGMSGDGLQSNQFPSDYALQHYRGIIKWLLNKYPEGRGPALPSAPTEYPGNPTTVGFFDPNQILVGGFSLGGVTAPVMAAAHQNPADLMFAGCLSASGALDPYVRWAYLVNSGSDDTASSALSIVRADASNGAPSTAHSPYSSGAAWTAAEHRLTKMGLVKVNHDGVQPGLTWSVTHNPATVGVGTQTYYLLANTDLVSETDYIALDETRSQMCCLTNTPLYLQSERLDNSVAGFGGQYDLLKDYLLDHGHGANVYNYTQGVTTLHDWASHIDEDNLWAWISERKLGYGDRHAIVKQDACVGEDRKVGFVSIVRSAATNFGRARVSSTATGWSIDALTRVTTLTLDASRTPFGVKKVGAISNESITIVTDGNLGSFSLVIENLAETPTSVTGSGFGSITIAANKVTIPVTGALSCTIT